MEPLEILKSACGKDDNSQANSAITINLYQIKDELSKLNPLYSHTAFNPAISIKNTNEFVIIDLIFNSPADSDLQIFWTLLEKYGNTQSVTNEAEEIHLCNFVIVPKKYDGQYYIDARDPIIWTLQPIKPNQPLNIIRLLFANDSFSLYETDDIDVATIEAEVEREVEESERQILIAEEKQAERDAMLEKREAEFTKQRFGNK